MLVFLANTTQYIFLLVSRLLSKVLKICYIKKTIFPIRKFLNYVFQTSSPGEALSTFIRASRDPKGETLLQVAKSTKRGILIGKTKPKHFPSDTKTNLKKSRK